MNQGLVWQQMLVSLATWESGACISLATWENGTREFKANLVCFRLSCMIMILPLLKKKLLSFPTLISGRASSHCRLSDCFGYLVVVWTLCLLSVCFCNFSHCKFCLNSSIMVHKKFQFRLFCERYSFFRLLSNTLKSRKYIKALDYF